MTRKICLVLLAFWAHIGVVFSQLRVAEIFGSHMVLQQNAQVPVWGWAAAGDTVRLRCSWLPERRLDARADANGRWSVTLPTSAGSLAPQQLRMSDGKNTVVLEDVLIGEVWLCSGQSNMEWRVRDCNYSPAQTRASEYPHIRHVKVNQTVSLEPQEHLDAGAWQVCDDTTAQQFTAVGYFFARELADKYRVPVGLVNSSWGGSQVESWVSGEGMARSDLFKNYMADFPKTWVEADARSLAKIKRYILGSDRPGPTAEEEAAYLNPDFDVSNWRTVYPSASWDWQQVWAFRGTGYMVFDFELDEKAATADATLRLGYYDGPAEIFVNGQRTWSGKNDGPLEILVPASLLKSGKNRLLLKQTLGKSTTWVEMGTRGNESDFWLKTAQSKMPLTGKWRIMPSFADPLYFVHSCNNIGTAIYNAMIHPLVRFPIKGAIWYQGETNAGRAHEYRQAFPLLIQDWRRLWGQEFPFLFVQLANYQAGNGTSNSGSDWAELREAQTLTLQLPKTGMAVTVDIGDSKDIHPKNKLDVGKRLAREAMRAAYGEALPPGSPTQPPVQFLENRAVVTFPTECTVRDKYGYVHGFEVAGEDRVFHYAKAEVSGRTLTVQAAAVPRPVAVRYAWADDPNDVNLYTIEGFPVAPFRSDDWKCRTEGRRFEH